jgi:hypothetical protein
MSDQPPYEPPPQQPYSQQPPPPPQPGQYAYPVGPPRPNSSNAVTALILGILGLVMCGPFTAIPALILGRKATREIDASQGQLEGRGMAQAGFILGIVGTAVGVVALLIVVVVFVFGAMISSTFEETCNTVESGDSFTVECN